MEKRIPRSQERKTTRQDQNRAHQDCFFRVRALQFLQGLFKYLKIPFRETLKYQFSVQTTVINEQDEHQRADADDNGQEERDVHLVSTTSFSSLQ